MVLFCLNKTGNHIPKAFNHSAMSLPHSIRAAHNLRWRQEDLHDSIYFREMDVSDICVTLERKHLQAENGLQKHPFWWLYAEVKFTRCCWN